MRLGFAVVAVLMGVSAVAAPRVAVHPLVVTGGDARAVDQSRLDFIAEAARQPIQMVSRLEVIEVLAHQPGAACSPTTEVCLEILCRETGATYALLITLVLDGPNFVLGARVVAANGTFVKSVEAMSIEKDLFTARGPQVQAAFKKLFAQLDLGALPEIVPPKAIAVVVPPPPAPGLTRSEPTPAPVSTAALDVPTADKRSPGTHWGRASGLVVGGVALVTAGVATGFALSANSNGAELKRILEANRGLLPRAELGRAKSVDQNTGIATGLYVGAGVAAATSLALILLSVEGTPVAIAPVEGGAMVGWSGSF